MSAASNAVFLSYASQDADAARSICEALRGAGIEVWFDQSELVGGDAWDAKIRSQIKACALFVPVISANTQARREGYFRLEWKLAAQRTHTIADGTPFLLPVVIDAVRDADALVPEEFRAVQWTRLSGGMVTPQFVERVKKLLGLEGRDVYPRRPAFAAEPNNGRLGETSLVSKRARWKSGLIVAATVLVALAIWQPWHRLDRSTPSNSKLQPPTSKPIDLSSAKSIAVLPFENQSDDKENTAFFSDGMHEDILTSLANIPDLKVISRTSVMEYRGTTKKMSQIARELGVAYLLEGSVRRAGTEVQITGRLVRAASDEQLWAKKYQRQLTSREVFAIQASLATEIAGALKAVIAPETRKLLERKPTENLAAYDLYLQGRSLDSTTRPLLRNAEKLLKDAVERDPNFAEAWGALAATHAAFVYWEYDTSAERLVQADAAMARAVRLAPDSPEVTLFLGRYAQLGYRDFARATEQFEKLLRLQPSSSEAYYSLALAQRRMGRWREAVENFGKALELDPGNERPHTNYSTTLQAGRRYAEALALQRRLVAMTPDAIGVKFALARVIFKATGSRQEADEYLAQLNANQSDPRRMISERKYWAAMKGDYTEWRRLHSLAGETSREGEGEIRGTVAVGNALVMAAHGDVAIARSSLVSVAASLRSILEQQPTNGTVWSNLGIALALLGESEEALRCARKGVELLPESVDVAEGSRRSRDLAVVYAWTDHNALAIAELDRLLKVPSIFNFQNSVHTLRVDPAFSPLRGDHRFEALLKDPKNQAPLF
jgi:TolB-like protein/Flp pilus assembly protein TadD